MEKLKTIQFALTKIETTILAALEKSNKAFDGLDEYDLVIKCAEVLKKRKNDPLDGKDLPSNVLQFRRK